MSSDVRVRVRLGAIELSFAGARSFYESHVEGLLDRAAGAAPRAVRDAVTASPTSAEFAKPTPLSEGVAASPAASTEPPSAVLTPAPIAAPIAPRGGRYVPSGEFGRYIRRLGPDAQSPDRQVVALAFYLWNYERRATFGLEELEGCYRALGLPLPAGLDGILTDLTEQKRFLEPSGDAAFRLSRKGENYVKTRLLAS